MSDLVIDADVMRSAGTTEHPISRQARAVLEAVRASGHRLVHTAALKTEHDKHQSRFARTWRNSMVSRRQWVRYEPPDDRRLRSHLVRAQNPDSRNDESEVYKDAHLLEAASAADLRLVSQDSTAKALVKKACPLPDPYGRIVWADVTRFPDETVRWIEAGCPDRVAWRICR